VKAFDGPALASLGLPRGLLIYASERPPERHVVERAGIGLEILGVKMDGTPRDLDAPVRLAARRLVQQARYFRSEYTLAV
jgi:hypothetical protein